MLVIGLLGGIVVSAVDRVRSQRMVVECQSRLGALGVAISEYEREHGEFPRSTMPNPGLSPDQRLSWIVALTPYLAPNDYYWRMDRTKGWREEPNLRIVTGPDNRMLCPANPSNGNADSPGLTHFVGIVGLGADADDLAPTEVGAGAFGYRCPRRFNDFARGLSNTVIVAETMVDNGPWAAGGRPTVRSLEPAIEPYLGRNGQFSSLHRRGGIPFARESFTHLLFADGSVRIVDESCDPKVIQKMMTLRGAD
jgi:hypothetical protein